MLQTKPTLKRALNVIVGSALLAAVAPALALIATLIRALDGPGPVFERRERVRRRGAIFLAWQFRPLGWLHRYNLDQLPRLLNLARGDIDLLDLVHP